MAFGITIGGTFLMAVGFCAFKKLEGDLGWLAFGAILACMIALGLLAFLLETIVFLTMSTDASCKSCVCLAATLYWTWRAVLHGVAMLLTFVIGKALFPVFRLPYFRKRYRYAVWAILLVFSLLIVLFDLVLIVRGLAVGDFSSAQAFGYFGALTVTRLGSWVGPWVLFLSVAVTWGIKTPFVSLGNWFRHSSDRSSTRVYPWQTRTGHG